MKALTLSSIVLSLGCATINRFKGMHYEAIEFLLVGILVTLMYLALAPKCDKEKA